MKTILLYANSDPGFESRLAAALDLARLFEGHISCVQVSPFSFVIGDPLGGVFLVPEATQGARGEEAHRRRIEDGLGREGVSWDWQRSDSDPARLFVAQARLADVIVISLASPTPGGDGQALAAEILLHARAPDLAVPRAVKTLDLLGPPSSPGTVRRRQDRPCVSPSPPSSSPRPFIS